MLTDILIKKLVVPAKRREIPDGRISGLYLVVQPSGAKSWALRYRASGAPRKLTLGPYPAIDLATARKRAQEAIGDVAGGKDPAAAKRVARATARAAKATPDDLVENVVDDFVRLYASRKTRDWRETERLLKKDVAAPWRGKRLGEIERQHLAKLLDEIVVASAGSNATYLTRLIVAVRVSGASSANYFKYQSSVIVQASGKREIEGDFLFDT